jgi:hypothetical protein
VTQCRSDLVPVFACAQAAWTSTVTSCGYSAPSDWTCNVDYALTLTVEGATCGEVEASVVPYVILCSTGLGSAASPATASVAYHGVPSGGETVSEWIRVCVDVATPIQRCTDAQPMDTILPGPP